MELTPGVLPVCLLITTAAIVALVFWRKRDDRLNVIAGTLLICVAYGTASLAIRFDERGASAAAISCAVVSVILGILGTIVALWAIIRRLPELQSSEWPRSEERSRMNVLLAHGRWRFAIATLSAVVGSTALVSDNAIQRVATGAAIFVAMLLLTYITTMRRT